MMLLLNDIILAIGVANILFFGSSESKIFSNSELANGFPQICPKTNSKLPVYIPHEEDCSKYFICDSGIPHLKTCPLGLHFNRDLKACDFPDSAECDKNTNVTKDRMSGDGESSLCPAENSKYPVLVPHPDDCSKFYICNNGKAHLKQCHFGLHFSPKVETCDYPDKAGCGTENTKVPKGRMIGDDESSLCPAGNSKYPDLVPHPDDCSKFYICDNGKAHLKQCHVGLHFSSKVKACDYPNKAGCDAGFTKFPKGKISEDGLCPAENSKHPVLRPHPEDCRKFYICDSGSAHLKECHPGLHFNPKINACDYPRNARCDKGLIVQLSGIPSPYCPSVNGKSPIFFRHSTNCSVYYMCGNGLAYEFACPSRLHFNVRKQVCDYEWNSRCQNTNY